MVRGCPRVPTASFRERPSDVADERVCTTCAHTNTGVDRCSASSGAPTGTARYQARDHLDPCASTRPGATRCHADRRAARAHS